MAVEDEFLEVISDEQVGGQERPEGAVCRVIDSGLGQGLEEIVGVDEADGMSGADGRVAPGLSQETLAEASGSHQEDVPRRFHSTRPRLADHSQPAQLLLVGPARPWRSPPPALPPGTCAPYSVTDRCRTQCAVAQLPPANGG